MAVEFIRPLRPRLRARQTPRLATLGTGCRQTIVVASPASALRTAGLAKDLSHSLGQNWSTVRFGLTLPNDDYLPTFLP